MQRIFALVQCCVGMPLILGIALFCVSNGVHADTEKVIRYEYDGAGNIIRALSQELDAAPQVDQLTPLFINIGASNLFTATGTNLFGVDIISNDLDIMVTDVQSTKDSVSFRLRAGLSANIGNATLIFSNAIGQTQQSLAVVASPPELTPFPEPLAISSGNEITDISLIFSEPRPEDETYSIAITDSSIASTTTTTFTVLAGQDQISLSLSGLTDGVTNLIVSLAAKFSFYSFPVFVGTSFAQLLLENPDMRQRNLFSPRVGIYVRENNLAGPNVVISQPVGIDYRASNGQFFSKPVGVDYRASNRQFFSRPVGVDYRASNGQFYSQPVGVVYTDTILVYSIPVTAIYGAFIRDIQLATASVDSTITVDVQGFNLDEVSSVAIWPDTDITVDSFVTNIEGTTLTITVTIGAGAALGQHEINIEDATGFVSNGTGAPFIFEIQ